MILAESSSMKYNPMKKLGILVILLSPLLLSTTCNRIDRKLIQDMKVQTFLDGPKDKVYLQTVINLKPSLLAKKKIDSVQFIFSDDGERNIGIITQAIDHSKSTQHIALIRGLPLDKFQGNEILRVTLKARLFKKAKYLDSENILIAEYDLSQYK